MTGKTRKAESYQIYFDEKFDELKKEMATKECIETLKSTIEKQNNRIDALESRIVVMENLIAKLQDHNDDNEQYSRRLCLRINGIPPPPKGEKETGEDCLEKVKKVFNELQVDIPDSVLDRAHRIGRPQTVRGRTIHQVIVRFTTWRHKTKVYRARKKCPKYRIKLDLTKKRVKLLEKVNVFLEEKELGFAFADVNCRLCAKIGDQFHYFESEEDLLDVIRSLDELESEDSHHEMSQGEEADDPTDEAQDRCARMLCPRFSACRNMPKSHVCRCLGGRFKTRGRCARAKQIFQVNNFVLQRKFVARYKDTRSSSFTSQAEEIENALIKIYQHSTIAQDLGSVKIAKLERGSVIAKYYLLYKRKTAYSLDQVEAVASNSSLFSSLNPDVTSSPVVRASSLCETGGHGCGRRATCVASNSDAGYECRCKKRFEFRKGRCRKKRTFIEIIIPAVVGGLLFLFFTCLLIVLLCKRKQAKKEETLEGQRNVIHIERLHRSNDNVMVSLEGTSQGIWRVNGKR